MNMIEEYGRDAGKIWANLFKHEVLDASKIMEYAMLDDEEFSIAVGWLARENKIFTNGKEYRLGETNLGSKIGNNAGKIWQILRSSGELDVSSIAEFAHIPEKDIYAALGWLAREDKLEIISTGESEDIHAPTAEELAIVELARDEEKDVYLSPRWATVELDRLKPNPTKVKYRLK